MAEDTAQAALLKAREQLLDRLNALDSAIEALGDGGGSSLPIHRRVSVGDDKVTAVRNYIKQVRRARQSDIVKETGFNSGTVSTAVHALQQTGEVEPGPKEDRSRTWEWKG